MSGLTKFGFGVTLALLAASPVKPAAAAPLTVQAARVDRSWLEVRDGCGPGMRYSYRREGCVPDFGGPPPPRPSYDDPYRRPRPGFSDDGYDRPRPRFSDDRYDRPPPQRDRPQCPPGQRFSFSRQSCVWN